MTCPCCAAPLETRVSPTYRCQCGAAFRLLRGPLERRCEGCGNIFQPTRNDRRHCCDGCRAKAWRSRQEPQAVAANG